MANQIKTMGIVQIIVWLIEQNFENSLLETNLDLH